MRFVKLCARMACALPLATVIAVMAWYLWLQEEFMNAYDEFTA